MILVLALVLVMFFSSVAFVINGLAPLSAQTAETKLPDKFVLDGRVSADVETLALQNGMTVMEWHDYNGCCPDLEAYIDVLPSELSYQVLIQKLSDSNAGSGTWVFAKSIRGEKTWNASSYSDLLPPLCDVLVKPPIECGLVKFGNRSQ